MPDPAPTNPDTDTAANPLATVLPKVAIVGRPNVGKSSLLNALAGRRISIVDPTAGVTRDRVATNVAIPAHDEHAPPRYIELIDTGGYGIADSDNLTAEVEQQIARGIADADAVLFVTDAQAGPVPLDRTVADVLRHAKPKHAPLIPIANKVDGPSHEAAGYELATLGFGPPILTSATSKNGLDELHAALRDAIDFDALASRAEASTPPNPGILIAVVGKRNAGKSTLINALLHDDRLITSDVAGTTRDAVDVRLEYKGQPFTLIDTAGVRKTKSLAGDIEYYSQHRSLRSVRRADVCLLIIDAAVPVSQVDHQLVGEIVKHERPCVIVVNKWDLAEADHTQDEYLEYMDKELKGLSYAPVVFLSAKNEDGIEDALAMAENLYEQAGHRVGTGELNQVVEAITRERGPRAKSGKQAKIFYATQIDVHPPTIVFQVNHEDVFDHNYQRFLDNRLRDALPYSEVPIRMLFRGKESRYKNAD
ncbi:MAG: ribosome biogenesis GTPase Der [Planctomycetota bacterium]